VDVPAEWETPPEGHSAARLLLVRGLSGGHGEFDIHLERANAIQVHARVLLAILAEYDVRIAQPYGGAQNNAIPADAQAVLVARPEDVEGIERIVAEVESDLKVEYDVAEPNLRLEVQDADLPKQVFSADATKRLARLTSLIPNGVLSWSLKVPDRVETSNNLGTVRPTDEGARLMSTITAAVTSRKHEVLDRVRSLAALAGGGVTVEQFGLDAPEFAYRPDSELLKVASEAYRDVMGAEPNVEVSQCSLELGLFSNEAGRDTISIGTELHDLHNPKETVNHKSVARVWPLVREVVGRLG
jgi:dipeptidase D